MLDGIIHQAVDSLLVYLLFILLAGYWMMGQSHHAIAEERYLVARGGRGAHLHLVFRNGSLCLMASRGPFFFLSRTRSDAGSSQSGQSEGFQEVTSRYICHDSIDD